AHRERYAVRRSVDQAREPERRWIDARRIVRDELGCQPANPRPQTESMPRTPGGKNKALSLINLRNYGLGIGRAVDKCAPNACHVEIHLGKSAAKIRKDSAQQPSLRLRIQNTMLLKYTV